MTYKLKPCPFCGGAAGLNDEFHWRMGGVVFVQCKNEGCDVIGPTENTITKAIRAWNKALRKEKL